jgi:hypothetical protein
LFRYHGGKQLAPARKMPRPLSAKLEFVGACATRIESLEPFKDQLLALVEEFRQLTQTRHDIVHGALADTSAVNGAFQFIRLQTHPDTHEVMPFIYDLGEFPKLRKRLVRLGATAPKLAKQAFDARESNDDPPNFSWSGRANERAPLGITFGGTYSPGSRCRWLLSTNGDIQGGG